VRAKAPLPEASMSIAQRSQDWLGGEPSSIAAADKLNRRGATCASSSRRMIDRGVQNLGVGDSPAGRGHHPRTRFTLAHGLRFFKLSIIIDSYRIGPALAAGVVVPIILLRRRAAALPPSC
jgi:hypothetical protein